MVRIFTHSLLYALLYVAVIIAPLNFARGETIDFETFAPSAPSSIIIREVAGRGIAFPRGVLVVKGAALGQPRPPAVPPARSGNNIMQPLGQGEFAQQDLEMRFAELQNSASFWVQPLYDATPSRSFTITLVGLNDRDLEVHRSSHTITTGRWQRLSGGVLGTASIRSMRVLVPRNVAQGTSEFVAFDDIAYTYSATAPDTQPPVASITLQTITASRISTSLAVTDNRQIATVDIDVMLQNSTRTSFNICGRAVTNPCNALVHNRLYDWNAPAGTYTAAVNSMILRACDAAGNCTQPGASLMIAGQAPAPPVRPRIYAYKYEVNQSVQGALADAPPATIGTILDGYRMPISLRPNKDTVVRYYLFKNQGSTDVDFRPVLEVYVEDRNGRRVFSEYGLSASPNITPNTSAVWETPTAAQMVARLRVMRQSLARTANFVIPAAGVSDAKAIEVRLRDKSISPPGELSGWVRLPFGRPLRLGINLVVVNPASMAWTTSGVSSTFAGVESRILPFIQKVMPFSDVQILTRTTFLSSRGIMDWNLFEGGSYRRLAECGEHLDRVESSYSGSDAPARLNSPDPSWTLTLAVFAFPELNNSRDGCGGIAPVGDPDDDDDRHELSAITEFWGDVAGHEVSHVLGLEHVGSAFGECGGGCCERGFPYTNGYLGPNTWGIFTSGTAPNMQLQVVDACPTLIASQVSPTCRLAQNRQIYDFMSYAQFSTVAARNGLFMRDQNLWLSDISYKRLIASVENRMAPSHRDRECPSRAGATRVAAGLATDPTIAPGQQVLRIKISMGADGTLKMFPVTLVNASNTDLRIPAQSQFSMEIFDRSGRPALRKLMRVRELAARGGAGRLQATAIVPTTVEIGRIVITGPNEKKLSVEASKGVPAVMVNTPNGGEEFKRTGIIGVRWTSKDDDSSVLQDRVDVSSNGGRTWRTFAYVDPAENGSAQIPASVFEETKEGLIRIVSTDGVNVKADQSDAPFIISD